MRKKLAALAVALSAVAFVLGGCTPAYAPAAKTPGVDAEALGDPGVLRVGVDASSYPFAGQVGSGIEGVDVDVAAALADEMGLRLELVDIGVKGASALADGSVDAVMGLDSSKVSADDCWLSDAYLPSCVTLFATDGAAGLPEVSSMPVIGAQTQSLSAWVVSQVYGASALKASDALKAVFQDLADGGVGYAASDAVVGSYMLNSLGIDAAAVGFLEQPSGYCIGVDKDNTALQLAVTQSLSEIQGDGVFNVVMTRWLGAPIAVSGLPVAGSPQQEQEEAQPAEELAAQDSAEAPAVQEQLAEEPAVLDGYVEEQVADEQPGGELTVGANAVAIEN